MSSLICASHSEQEVHGVGIEGSLDRGADEPESAELVLKVLRDEVSDVPKLKKRSNDGAEQVDSLWESCDCTGFNLKLRDGTCLKDVLSPPLHTAQIGTQ